MKETTELDCEASDDSKLITDTMPDDPDESYNGLSKKNFSGSPKLQKRQWRYVQGIILTSSFGNFLWGYNISVIAGAMLLVDDHYQLSILWHEVIVSILLGGATVGAAIAGWLSDKFGRWKMMMCTAVLYGVGAIIMATSFSKFCLVVGRAIAGLALGMRHCVHCRNHFYK